MTPCRLFCCSFRLRSTWPTQGGLVLCRQSPYSPGHPTAPCLLSFCSTEATECVPLRWIRVLDQVPSFPSRMRLRIYLNCSSTTRIDTYSYRPYTRDSDFTITPRYRLYHSRYSHPFTSRQSFRNQKSRRTYCRCGQVWMSSHSVQ